MNVLNQDGVLTVIYTHKNSESSILLHNTDECKKVEVFEGFTRYYYEGANALDKLMKNSQNMQFNKNNEHHIFNNSRFSPFSYKLIKSNAKPPEKARPSDSGFDLHIIDKIKRHGNVTLYGTGVCVTPPVGYYFDMVPRSSLSKTGYMLANSVGVIDQGYTGEIMVPLIKLDESALELDLPQRVVQLIPRRWYGFTAVEVDNLIETTRNEGGFGSSG